MKTIRYGAALAVSLLAGSLLGLAEDSIDLRMTLTGVPQQIELIWSGGTGPFAIYRSTNPSSVSVAANRLGVRNGTDWIDQPVPQPIYYYQVGEAVRAVNVRDFGAQCGGVDATDAFNAAIVAAGTGGQILVPACPVGTGSSYVVSGGVLLRDGQHLVGESRLTSVIECLSRSDTGIAAAVDGTQDLEVASLRIQSCEVGLDARAVEHSKFHDLMLFDNQRGILLGRRTAGPTTAATLWDEFRRIRVDCPVPSDQNPTPCSMIRAMEVDLSTGDTGDMVNSNIFVENTFEHSLTRSVFQGAGGEGLAANTFIGNTWQGGEGIHFGYVSGLVLEGNYFEGSPINSAQLDLGGDVFGATIAGNFFTNPDATAIRIGSDLGGPIRGVRVEGNYFAGKGLAQQLGIEVDPGIGDAMVYIGPNEYQSLGSSFSDPTRSAWVNWGTWEAMPAILKGNLPGVPLGGMVYCSDCTRTDPCNSGGTGAIAKFLGGTWRCN